ncbi:MAG: Asp23/Gls24 family envelope stress response protein [Lachnospiraceae bacterium]|nr:Asp23/Gls24 family envelope stress response protein [Lachnospiraceae bacterium]
MEDNRNIHTIHDDDLGEVRIADDVVAIIAGLAATEVEGVAAMYGNITNELVSKLGMKNLSKGVKAELTEEGVLVDLTLNVKFGYSIKEVSLKVQEKVKSAIETMTGLNVEKVDIRIANITVGHSE